MEHYPFIDDLPIESANLHGYVKLRPDTPCRPTSLLGFQGLRVQELGFNGSCVLLVGCFPFIYLSIVLLCARAYALGFQLLGP